MPSLWPFAARDDSSPASFEKALSRLSTQITSSTVSLERSRTSAHRAKAFWTLWATLAYLVYTAIIALVLGPQQWNLPHYAGLAGTPILIYGVRRMLALLFDWQIARRQRHLDKLVKERDQKIAQLKKAMRYDTTQELLNKYGGNPPRTQAGEKQGVKRKVTPSRPAGQPLHVQRTGIPPPPTANIPGRGPLMQQRGSGPATPARQEANTGTTPPPSRDARSPSSSSMLYNLSGIDLSPEEPGFAPNAFSAPPPPPPPPPPQPSSYAPNQSRRWYDRILDVMLGEDEASAKNRLALICAHCRLVNGQAPPGVVALEEVGRWRCGSCGAWNGVEKVEHQVGRMVEEMKMKEEKDGRDGRWTNVSRGEDDDAPKSRDSSDRNDLSGSDVEVEHPAAGTRTSNDLPDLTDSSDGETGETGRKAGQSVARRVAKTRRGGRRHRNQ